MREGSTACADSLELDPEKGEVVKDVSFYDIEGAWLSCDIISRRREGIMIGRVHLAEGDFMRWKSAAHKP